MDIFRFVREVYQSDRALRALHPICVAAAVLILSGCSQAEPSISSQQVADTLRMADQKLEGSSEEAKQALADGQLTREELESGFKRLSDCTSQSGLTVTTYFDRDEIRYDVRTGTSDEDEANRLIREFDACHAFEAEAFELYWSIRNAASTKPGDGPVDCDGSSCFRP